MTASLRAARLVFARQAKAALADPVPSFVLPAAPSLLMIVVFTAVFDGLAEGIGFRDGPFGSATWDAFLVPGAFVLVALLGAGYTSASLAQDLRRGYAERMSLAGANAAAMLGGRFAFEAVRLIPGFLVVLGIGLLVGAEANNGLVGVAVTVALIALLGLAFTGIFYLVAIRTKDPQTPFTMQPLGIPFAFLSSALVPIAIMPGWSAAIARANPVSVVVDAARNAMIGDLWSPELGAATAILVGWSLVAVTVATAVLARELRDAR
jgi:ABC-2 type transport system permease protein